jgi:hypothetical protein
MPQSVETAIKVWLSPVLLTALVAVCSYLWADQAHRMDRMADKIDALTETVAALKAVAGK